MGTRYLQLSLEDRCRIASLQGPRPFDPANRGRSGSRAIDHCSRDQAQHRPQGRLQTRIRRRADQGTPLEGLQARKRPKPRSRSSSNASGKAGRPNRSPAGSPANGKRPPSATRPSTASSTPRSHAPKTTAGATISPAPRASADGAACAAAAPHPSSKAESRSHSAQPKPAIGKRRGTGKPTS